MSACYLLAKHIEFIIIYKGLQRFKGSRAHRQKVTGDLRNQTTKRTPTKSDPKTAKQLTSLKAKKQTPHQHPDPHKPKQHRKIDNSRNRANSAKLQSFQPNRTLLNQRKHPKPKTRPYRLKPEAKSKERDTPSQTQHLPPK